LKGTTNALARKGEKSMPERLHPGVYIEEVPSGVRPIEGVSTSTAAFIGKAEMGALNQPVLVTNLQEYQAKYGSFLRDSFLSHALLAFFNNGGKKAYVLRVAGAGAAAAAIAIRDRKAAPATTLTIRAINEGAWGNKLDIVITNGTADPDNEFNIQVFRDRSDLVPPQTPLLLETLPDLSMNSTASNYVEKVVKEDSQFIAVEVDAANVATAGPGTSRSGRQPVGNGADLLGLTVAAGATETAGTGGATPTAGTVRSAAGPNLNPPADRRSLAINLNGDGAKEITLPATPSTGPDVAAAIQTAVRALTATSPANQAAYDGFTATFDPAAGGAYVLTSGTLGTTSTVSVTNAAGAPLSLPAGTFRFTIFVNGDGPHEVVLTGPFADPEAVRAAMETAIRALPPKRAANAAAFSGFTVTYENTNNNAGNPSFLFTSGTAGVNSSVRISNGASDNVATLLRLGTTNQGSEINGSAVLRPANSQDPTEYHLGDAVVSGNVASIIVGDDGLTPTGLTFTSALPALDAVRDFSLLAIPGIGDLDVVAQATNYCTVRADCFFIGDTNSTDDTVAEAQTFVNSLTVKSSYGAVYYPWLKMTDPSGLSAVPIAAPPSGFVAGLYARIDSKRGVFKAPAGTEANIGGAVGLMADTTDVQQDFLNPIGVNVIRSFPASGLVIWGARTLATRSDPEYRYIPVRRTAIFLQQSIYNGIQYAVFEPNDFPLWNSLRLNISAFMLRQFRAGMFQGKTPTDAFFVQVDEKTTTQADIDAGVVNILVGFAPLKPAEFVVLKFTQKVNQPAA
jgi:phage tail sheath protein FI